MDKIDKLIEEATNPEQQYVYHYSAQKFPEVKTRAMLGLPAPKEASNPQQYNSTISLLPAPLSKEIILRYRQQGFKNWGKGPLYEYKISIPKNASSFYEDIKFASTPEETRYGKIKPFKTFINKNGLDYEKLLKDDDYWNKVKDHFNRLKKEYMDKKDKYVEHLIGTPVTSRNYATHPYIRKLIDSFDYWVNYNLKNGNKSQYATYIPHLYTPIKKPLIPDQITQII